MVGPDGEPSSRAGSGFRRMPAGTHAGAELNLETHVQMVVVPREG